MDLTEPLSDEWAWVICLCPIKEMNVSINKHFHLLTDVDGINNNFIRSQVSVAMG